jgi:tRNA threonylcarbamoyl adenosine modification protein (Sua5/YciO/YrdC/YwlC family)
MIEYIYPNNIDDRVLRRADNILQNDGLIAYPTDSSWAIGCSIKSKIAIDKLKRLKGGINSFTISLICSNIQQISDVALFSTSDFKIMKKLTPGPYVFILPARKHIEKVINMKRVEVGVRIPDHPVPQAIVNLHERPIFTISASKKMNENNWWDSEYADDNLFESGWELEDIEDVEMVIDCGEPLEKHLTTVLRLEDGSVELVREGFKPWE